MSTPDFAMPTSYEDREELEKHKDLLRHCLLLDWDHVVEAYKTNYMARRAQITKWKETALHLAIAAERSDIAMKLLDVINDEMEGHILEDVVNIEGNTPLHLAAARGDLQVCRKIILISRPQVVASRNNKGETPLFLAASHGKEKIFFFFHYHFPQEQLLRRGDGNTVVHMAIFHDYYGLALKVIQDHPDFAYSYNENGELPLHILANKPNVFRSSTTLALYDRIIYNICPAEDAIVHEEAYFEEEDSKNEDGSSKN